MYQTHFLDIKGLSVEFRTRNGTIRAVDDINFHLSIIDLVPKKLKDPINERTKKLNMIFEKNKDIDEKAFSNQILLTINWIKKIN